MDGFHSDVQELLADIDNNYGEIDLGQGTLHQARPDLGYHGSQLNSGLSLEQQQDLIHHQHSRPATYASGRLGSGRLHAPQYDELDEYDVALLAEPPPPPSWQLTDGFNGSTAGRLSLPSFSTSFVPPSNTCKQSETQSSRPVASTPQAFKSRIGQYIHTPPAQLTASSPSHGPPSSPSYRAKQRQQHHASRPSATAQTNRRLSSHRRHTKVQKRNSTAYHGDEASERPSFTSSSPPKEHVSARIELSHAPPLVQGVRLVPLHELSDRCRSVFRHDPFNAIQSRCFPTAYGLDDNLVVSAPTGGGKTAILELAICRLVTRCKANQYKIVYMAPTKSLCSERYRDWQNKFAALDLQCAELTGDTEHGQLRNVQGASIIITTPEKWDSMTRKWKDHVRLMQMVKLFLIDEVHILKDSRGATLEAVVSRMKSVGSGVRFVALSATVPNSEDIAAWLGKDPVKQDLPAYQERFGEDFRPVRLEKHVIGLPYKGSDFGFESVCDRKLLDFVSRYSHKKPVMVFCMTRKAAVNTAKLLAHAWAGATPRNRYWEGPTRKLIVQDLDLKDTLISGVAFHHGGLELCDRHVVEKGFLEGQVNVICCTSTLAVGVNLPCHMVIIKNTVTYSEDALKEYSDLEVMQMLGRAGRPQFDTSAVAVIVTKQEKVGKYEKLVSGEEILESCLHLNLIDHLNAEIGLGTIHDVYTAKRWLAGTFLYVRLKQNPDHYKLDGDAKDQDLNDRIERVCKRDLALLETTNLIKSSHEKLEATEFGDTMARYYVSFKTMQTFLRLQPRPKMSDIFSVLVQAQEYQEIRLKATEKKLFKTINQANGIKFPIKVDIALPAHKKSLILQTELGGVDFPSDEQYSKHKRQFNQEKAILFSHILRLIRCMIDCQVILQDAVGARHALELARSFNAKVWDNSPYQLKQIAQIGLVAIRKLAIGGINSLEALEAAEPQRIEMLMSRNPPFGQKLLSSLKDFPKLWVSVKLVAKTCIQGQPVIMKIRAQCGFMNEREPTTFHKKPIYICLLTERSDGQLIDFRRIGATHLGNSKDILMSAELTNHLQYITCYVMCEAIAGTLRYAELRHDLPANVFPTKLRLSQSQRPAHSEQAFRPLGAEDYNEEVDTRPATLGEDEFAEENINDQDMVDAAAGVDFGHIDEYDENTGISRRNSIALGIDAVSADQTSRNPEKLSNGKWACNHKCKDKTSCKHMCCRDGVDKAPKPSKKTIVPTAPADKSPVVRALPNTGRCLQPARKSVSGQKLGKEARHQIEKVDLVRSEENRGGNRKMSRAFDKFQPLQTQQGDQLAALRKGSTGPPRLSNDKVHRQPRSSKSDNPQGSSALRSSVDYDDAYLEAMRSPSASLGQYGHDIDQPSRADGRSIDDELPSPSTLMCQNDAPLQDMYDADSLEEFDVSHFDDGKDGLDSDLEAAMVGLGDSIDLNEEDSSLRPASVSDNPDRDGSGRLQARDFENETLFPPRKSQNGHSNEKVVQPALTEAKYGSDVRSNNADSTRKEAAENRLPKPDTNFTEQEYTGSGIPSGLFLSTDSPEKQSDSQRSKRECAGQDGEAPNVTGPVQKKLKMSDQSAETREPLPNAEDKNSEPAPVIKAGHPAWVYDFDPKFIAEWEDIVEFV